MGRAPCCEKVGLKRGRWTAEEDEILINYIKQNGDGSWRSLPKNAGLLRCGKSCRLRWINYLREDLKRGNFTREEEETIIKLHRSLGNKWSLIASNLPGRTDNEVKNYWNSHLSRKIYSFRSCNGSMVTTIDMVKMASSNRTPCKRKGGRVSRAVAKKYNANSISKLRSIQEAKAAQNAEVAVGENRKEEQLKNVVIHDDKVERESTNSIDDFICNGSLRWGANEASLENIVQENECLGPSNGLPEEEDVELLLQQIWQEDFVELSEISLHGEETGKNSMDLESAASSNNESDHGTNSNSDTGDDMYDCFSPLNSYFNNHDSLSWEKEYSIQGFQLWDEGDDLIWP